MPSTLKSTQESRGAVMKMVAFSDAIPDKNSQTTILIELVNIECDFLLLFSEILKGKAREEAYWSALQIVFDAYQLKSSGNHRAADEHLCKAARVLQDAGSGRKLSPEADHA